MLKQQVLYGDKPVAYGDTLSWLNGQVYLFDRESVANLVVGSDSIAIALLVF